MSWVLRRIDGKPPHYVNHPGSEKSYTHRRSARRFPTREAALADACGNEVPEKLGDL